MNRKTRRSRRSSEERAARARIEAAASCCAATERCAGDFAALLFGRAAPEDLVGYEAAELARSLRDA